MSNFIIKMNTSAIKKILIACEDLGWIQMLGDLDEEMLTSLIPAKSALIKRQGSLKSSIKVKPCHIKECASFGQRHSNRFLTLAKRHICRDRHLAFTGEVIHGSFTKGQNIKPVTQTLDKENTVIAVCGVVRPPRTGSFVELTSKEAEKQMYELKVENSDLKMQKKEKTRTKRVVAKKYIPTTNSLCNLYIPPTGDEYLKHMKITDTDEIYKVKHAYITEDHEFLDSIGTETQEDEKWEIKKRVSKRRESTCDPELRCQANNWNGGEGGQCSTAGNFGTRLNHLEQEVRVCKTHDNSVKKALEKFDNWEAKWGGINSAYLDLPLNIQNHMKIS